MKQDMDLKQVIDEKAVASPAFSYQEAREDIRISFKRGGVKISYLVEAEAICQYDMSKEDWGMFYKGTSMDNLDFFVPVDDFKSWLKKQASGEEHLQLV